MAHFTWLEFNGDHVHGCDPEALGRAVQLICRNHFNEREIKRDADLSPGTLSYLGEAYDPWTVLTTPQHTIRTLQQEVDSLKRRNELLRNAAEIWEARALKAEKEKS